MTKRLIAMPALAVAAAALTACTAEMDRETEIRAPAVEVVGEAKRCIETNRIQNTVVHDDRTIDFDLGRETYRNTLPARCSGLGFEERFAYKTTIGQLCSIDVITVLQSGGIRGATCGLGEFVPVRYVETGD